MISEKKINKFEIAIGYIFKNKKLLINSLVHPSSLIDNKKNKNNLFNDFERLEFLGDSILGFTIAEYMYLKYPEQSEGFLSKMRTKIVNGKMLGYLSECIGFPKFAIISKQIEDINGRENYKIMEDIFEAFIGALYLDSNDINIVKRWIISIIENNIDMVELILKNTNYKDMLILYMQNRFQDVPRFFETNIVQNNMQKIFNYIVKDRDNNILSSGTGISKKDAENNVAYEALKYYGEL